MADKKSRPGKFEKVKRPFDVRGVSGDTYLGTGSEDKQQIIRQITKTFTGQSFAINIEALTPRESKEKVAAYRQVAEQDLKLTLQGDPYVDPETGNVRQPTAGKIEKSAASKITLASRGRKPGKYAVLLANAKLKPGFMTVAAGDAGLTPAEIRDKLISNATRGEHTGEPEPTSDYRALSQEFGTTVHQMLQKEYLRGGALEVERKFYNKEGSVRGSADILTRGSRIIEIKSVTGGIFKALLAKQEAYPTHIVQLNTYLASLGKTQGQIIYVNRENISQRLTFEFKFNQELWERTKLNIEKGQKLALRTALTKGIPLSNFYNSEMYGPSEGLPSDEELQSQYSSMLFKSLTTRRGMPSDLERVRKERSKRRPAEGLLHGWFGSTRGARTDFGSGFNEWYDSAPPGAMRPSRKTAKRALDDSGVGVTKDGVVFKKPRVASSAPPQPNSTGGALIPPTSIAQASGPQSPGGPAIPSLLRPRGGLYEFIRGLEERSPWQILKTFRISEKMQPWVLASRVNEINIPFEELIKPGQANMARAELYLGSKTALPEEVLTAKGKLWQRALGGKLPIDVTTRQLTLESYKGSMFKVKGTTRAVEVSQMDTRAIMQKAMREGIVEEPTREALKKAATRAWETGEGLPFGLGKVFGKGGVYEDMGLGKKMFYHTAQREMRGFQKVAGYAPLNAVDLAETPFKRGLSLIQQKASSAAFGGYLRINRLLNEVGLGLRTGTFDRVATLPFHNTLAKTAFGKAMKLTPNLKGGIVNKLLTRRFLPAMAIAGAAKYADYLTGHAVSNLPVHAYVTAKKAAANISDTLGFPRKYRELMEKTSPFPLYGPALVFPAIGFFAGATAAVQMSRRGALGIEEGLAKLGQANKFTYFEKFAKTAAESISSRGFSPAYQALRGGMARKGAKIGLMASLPWLIAQLIPGKSAEEYEQIYSGQKEVAVKKGRWWESCLVSDTAVRTSRGFIPIVDVIPGDEVITHTGKSVPISAISSHQESITYELHSKSFLIEKIRGTPEHELFVFRKEGHLGWSSIEDIAAGDCVAYPLPSRTIASWSFEQYIDNEKVTLTETDADGITWLTRLQQTRNGLVTRGGSRKLQCGRDGYIPLTHELGLIFGTYLGDGNVFRDKVRLARGVEFAFGLGEISKAEEIQRAMEHIFGLRSQIQKKGNMYRLRYLSSLLGEIFENLFQGTSKIVPWWMYLSRHLGFYKGLLSGLIDADGCIAHHTQLVFSNTNQNIIHLFWQACLYIGVYTQVREKRNAQAQAMGHKKCYSIHISSGMSRKFKGLISSVKCERLAVTGHISDEIGSTCVCQTEETTYVLFPIVSKIRIEELVRVHDICVPDVDHSFLGFSLAYHNSSTPYQGDKVQEYRKHWIARFLNRDRIKEEYGSEKEYWRRSLLTPVGWFNLLTDPYGKERTAAARGRRFPVTEEVFTDVPFVGKNIGRWIGHTIKPQRFMYGTSLQDYADMYQSENPEMEPSYTLGGLRPQKPTLASSFRNVISDTIDEALTQVGLPGWLTKLGLRATTGSQRPLQSKEPRLQSAGSVGSKERWFYGLDLGGGAFTTETVRRFIQNTPRDIQTYNPLLNENIPSWLSSENELRKYHFGDPLDKAPAGTGMWLPGPAYNERMGLPADLSPEDYPEMHKLAILAHLQPYSKRIPRMIKSLQSEDLTPEQSYFVSEMNRQAQELRKSEAFQDRVFTGEIDKYQGQVIDSAGEFFRLKERPYKQFKLAGVSFELNDIANQLMHEGVGRDLAISRASNLQEEARSEAQGFLTKGANISFYSERGAPEGVEKPGAVVMAGTTNVNKYLASKYHLPLVDEGAVSQLLYTPAERALGQFSESISHDSPIPFINKFMGANDPLEKYKREQVYGKKVKLWDKPIEHYFKPGYWNIHRRIGTKFNSFSAKDDTFNTIEGLQGSIHKQFGIFGSGLLSSAGKAIRNLVREYGGEVKKLAKYWNQPLQQRRSLAWGWGRGKSAGSALTAHTPKPIREWAGLAGGANYTSFMSRAIPYPQRMRYFKTVQAIRGGKLGSNFSLKRLPLFNFRGLGEGTSRTVGGMFTMKGWHPAPGTREKFASSFGSYVERLLGSTAAGAPEKVAEKGVDFALAQKTPYFIKAAKRFGARSVQAINSGDFLTKDLVNIAGKQSRRHMAFVKGMMRGGRKVTEAGAKKIAAYYGGMSEEIVGNMMETLSLDKAAFRDADFINENAFQQMLGAYKANPAAFKAKYGAHLRTQFGHAAAQLEGGRFTEEFYGNVVKESALYRRMAHPLHGEFVTPPPGASPETLAMYESENLGIMAARTRRTNHAAVIAQMSHPIENINNLAAAKLRALEEGAPAIEGDLLDTAIAEREAAYNKHTVPNWDKPLPAEVPPDPAAPPIPTSHYNPPAYQDPITSYMKSAGSSDVTAGRPMPQPTPAPAAKPPNDTVPSISMGQVKSNASMNPISAKDDAALKVEGMGHGWFGKTRKDRTNFGSGLAVGLLDDIAYAAYRGFKTQSKHQRYESMESEAGQSQLELYNYLRGMHAQKSMDYVKHIGYGQGLHPGGDGFSTAITREKTSFGSGFMSPDKQTPVPGYTSKARQIQEYFDKLTYMKYRKLYDKASAEGDEKKSKYFYSKMNATMIGANPIASEPEQIVSLLPKAERPYFSEFVKEPDPERRSEIMSMVPKYEQRLLLGQWFRQSVDSDSLADSAKQTAAFIAYAKNEGYANMASEAGGAERARESELQEFFDETGLNVPEDDWIGWDERVDNKDLMMMYVQKAGEDIHDYDLWEDRQSMMRRKPYLNGAVDPLRASGHARASTNVSKLFGSLGLGNAQATRFENGNNEINLTIRVDPDTIVQRSGLKDELVQTLPKTRKEGWDSVDFYASNPATSPKKGIIDHQRRSVSEERKRTEMGVF